jgi:hypothetical protein
LVANLVAQSLVNGVVGEQDFCIPKRAVDPTGLSSMGGVTFDISISVDRYTSSASPRTPIAQSEAATFANGWLTKMIKPGCTHSNR